MEAARRLEREIRRVVAESPANRHPDGSGPYFEEPLVGVAEASDPLFLQYKDVIGGFHQTPREVFEEAHGPGSLPAGSVVAWILPVSEETRRSNRGQKRLPSVAWARTRAFGEKFNSDLRRHVVDFLSSLGHRAVAPLLGPRWRTLDDPRVGLASTWSERHAAYAAGLGTFSLNDALITPKGIAHRIGSVVTDLVLSPSDRPYPDRRHNCLFFREGTCGACVDRCPAGALSREGHDKVKCRKHVYRTVMEEMGNTLGVAEAGCGLCQTGVPCESRIPPGSRRGH